MAVAVLGGTEVGLREIGHTVSIPNDNRARLMYYLDCICSVLDMSDQSNLARLRNFSSYYLLSDEEVDALAALCFLLSPDELNGKVIFQNDDLCGSDNNKFLELSAVQSNMILSENILIAGQRRTVKKIMVFKMSWLNHYWTEPMRAFAVRLASIAAAGQRQSVEPPRRQAIEYRRPVATQPSPSYQPTYNYYPPKHSSCCTIL